MPTLIEVLIALLISAILVTFSIPLSKHFLQHTHDDIMQRQLLRAIDLAKFESQSRHLPVSLCKTKNEMNCGGDWKNGLLIFLDENADGIVREQTQIISVIQMMSQHGSLHWRSFPGYRNYILFLPTGWMRSDNGTFWHCHEKLPVWAIVMNKLGRTRVVYPDQNGEIKDDHGKPLFCT